MVVLMGPELGGAEERSSAPGRGGQHENKGGKNGTRAPPPMGTCIAPNSEGTPDSLPHPHPGTIPPIKSAQGEGDDVRKLFTIGCPVILATLGLALLFIVRKKRKEKRLKRLRGGGGSFLCPLGQER